MTSKQALIVDDEPDIRELLEITLGRMDINTLSAEDLASARQLLADNHFDFCLTDMNLPDGNGIQLVEHISTQYPEVPVAMITAHGNMDSAVEALKAGAFDFVSKPVNLQLLRSLVDTALNLSPEASNVSQPDSNLLGDSKIMSSLRSQITKIARSQAPIYISGESGSGKELVARSIHDFGPHASGPFIPVNCGAIPTELMESEFFGHTKGSFTGAVADKEGLFKAASGGTLFLDEVADLPLAMQVKLLRGIQEKAIRPVGAQSEIAVDVRILSATHKDLAAEVNTGRFRQDLYYRINVIELNVPSLRQRLEDIPVLASHLIERIAREYAVTPPTISQAAVDTLQSYHFPGNVRELHNILERAITLCENSKIEEQDLQITKAINAEVEADAASSDENNPADGNNSVDDNEVVSDMLASDSPAGQPLPENEESLDSYLEKVERNAIIEALEATRWNKTAAAKLLGITFRALRYKLKKLDLE